MFRKAFTAILARSAVFAVLAISALAQAQSSWGQQTGLTNPGFEAPRVEEGTYVLVETMPGWKTTDKEFEIWDHRSCWLTSDLVQRSPRRATVSRFGCRL